MPSNRFIAINILVIDVKIKSVHITMFLLSLIYSATVNVYQNIDVYGPQNINLNDIHKYSLNRHCDL